MDVNSQFHVSELFRGN